MDIEKLLRKANEYIQNPDTIIDVYDMSYVWISKKQCDISGYDEKEQIDKQIAMNTTLENVDLRKTVIDDVKPNELREKKLLIKTKSGKEKILTVQSITFEFNNQLYLAGKILQVENKN